MSSPAQSPRTEYWLPEDYELRLTALELGALTAILCLAQKRGEASFPVNKRGPEGQKIETTMIERLLEKTCDLVDSASGG
jgi:hypothetical protein